MGAKQSKLASLNVPIIGLDSAGKSSIMHCICANEEAVATVPTIGFSTDHMIVGKIKWSFWDLAGQEKSRSLWSYYLGNAALIIFVIDLGDKNRVSIAKDELHKVVTLPEVENLPLLIFANKIDLEDRLQPESLPEQLHLNDLKQKYAIFACCAIKNEGVNGGIEWAVEVVGGAENIHSKSNKKHDKTRNKNLKRK